jgi:hypothetical protein
MKSSTIHSSKNSKTLEGKKANFGIDFITNKKGNLTVSGTALALKRVQQDITN